MNGNVNKYCKKVDIERIIDYLKLKLNKDVWYKENNKGYDIFIKDFNKTFFVYTYCKGNGLDEEYIAINILTQVKKSFYFSER